MSDQAGLKPRIRIRRDPYVVKISLREGVEHRHRRPHFVVLSHLWYEPRPHLKLIGDAK